jgi:nucleoside phosphorylase
MEAYAIAKACISSGVEFICHKFISDRANAESTGDWRMNIGAGQQHYLKVLGESAALKV